jgi:hypothetical protein
MELKWFAFIMVGFPLAITIGMGWDSYNVNRCREKAIEAKMSADEITRICRRSS